MSKPLLALAVCLFLSTTTHLGADDDAVKLHAAAVAKIQAGSFAEAIALLDQCIAKDPATAVYWKDRGRARQMLDDLDGAIADYDRAIAVEPALAMAWNNRGCARRSKGDHTGAMADLARAIALDPKLDFAYVNRGYTHIVLGDLAAAKADIERALELGTKYRDYPALWLWTIRARMGDKPAADDGLRKHLATLAPDAAARSFAARLAALLLGDADEAGFLAELDKDTTPEGKGMRCEAHYFAGTRQRVLGRDESAVQHFRKAVAQQAPGYVEHHAALRALEEMGHATAELDK